MWFYLLDKLLEYYQEYIANNRIVDEAIRNPNNPDLAVYRQLAQTYSEYISSFFDDLCKNVTVESIMAVWKILYLSKCFQKLQDYRSLRLGDLKKSLIVMLETYFYESNILRDAKTLIVGDTYESISELYNRTVTFKKNIY